MPVNMRNAIEQAACDVGRALAKYEMLTGATAGETALTVKLGPVTTGPVTKANTKYTVAPAKAAKPVARGVKVARGPKTKGVKEAILAMIDAEMGNGGITTNGLVAKLGFKASSVNATLAGLKKANMIVRDGKCWLPTISGSGNSGEAGESGESFEQFQSFT